VVAKRPEGEVLRRCFLSIAYGDTSPFRRGLRELSPRFSDPTSTKSTPYTKTHVSHPRRSNWPHTSGMTQLSVPAWSQGLQLKMMAAIDAAWRTLETSDDPATVRRARDKAKACGEMAAVVRKIAAMTGLGGPKPPAAPEPAFAAPAATPVSAQAEHAVRALDRLKGGRRGRL
jgi:hypothetical protein